MSDLVDERPRRFRFGHPDGRETVLDEETSEALYKLADEAGEEPIQTLLRLVRNEETVIDLFNRHGLWRKPSKT